MACSIFQSVNISIDIDLQMGKGDDTTEDTSALANALEDHSVDDGVRGADAR